MTPAHILDDAELRRMAALDSPGEDPRVTEARCIDRIILSHRASIAEAGCADLALRNAELRRECRWLYAVVAVLAVVIGALVFGRAA